MTPTAVSSGIEDDDKSAPTTVVAMVVTIGMDVLALIVNAVIVVTNLRTAGYINNNIVGVLLFPS